MAGRQLGQITSKILESGTPAALKRRATDFAKKLKAEYEAGLREEPTTAEQEATADEVSEAMRKVDWTKVKATTASKTADVSQSVKTMAAQVDWDRVTPVAAEVSAALIAAVASGQLPIGGAMGARVARTIMNDHGLAQQVARSLARTPEQHPPDFRPLVVGAIETTATE